MRALGMGRRGEEKWRRGIVVRYEVVTKY